MAYLDRADVEAMGFRKLGRNVRISSRAAIYDPHLIELGDHCRIDDFCVVSGVVTLGRNVMLTVHCNVAGGQTGVTIEAFSSLAYGCHVFAQSEDYAGNYLNNSTVPEQYRSGTKKAVRIGRHCIIGTNTVIQPGVTLAEGTAVYAMSLVTKSTEPWSIYLGNPARRIKSRNRGMLEMEQRYLESEERHDLP